jgi:hypothetical protein
MPVYALWDNDAKTILRFDFVGKWDWTQYSEALHTAIGMLGSVPHMVDVIPNFTESGPLPANTLSHFSRSSKESTIDTGHTVVVTNTKFVEVLINTFGKLYGRPGKKTLSCNSLEEARKILASLAEKA